MSGRERSGRWRARAAFYAGAVRGLVTAGARRALRGGRHPDWPWPYELAMAVLRVAYHEHHVEAAALGRTQVSPVPRALATRVALTRGVLGRVAVERHEPRLARAGAQLLYLHGGGYVTCSPASHRDVVARLADVLRVRCVVPDYRLAPQHPFPAALDDVLACYRALLAAGQAPECLFVGGDSAGGGLALALLLALRDAGDPLPAGAILISPWVDLTESADALHVDGAHDYLLARRMVDNAASYAGATPLDHPLVSPLHADLTGLPPLLMQTGEWELLCAQNRRLAARARAAGVEVEHEIEPGMLHAFTCFAGILPQGSLALVSLSRFVDRRLAASG